MNFAQLIDPITVEEFSRDYWEQKPLVVRRSLPAYYNSLMDKADLESLLLNGQIRTPEVNLFKQGRSLGGDRLRAAGWSKSGGQSPDTGLLYEAYARGYTVVARAEHWAPVAKLRRSLESCCHHTCAAELYATPRSSQGFDIHVDKGAVFVAQLEGRKHWLIYKRVTDTADEIGDRKPHNTRQLEAASGSPLMEVTLERGDLLYLPRGYPHSALTSDVPSFHLSIGLVPFEWNDLIREALQAVAAEHPDFHQALPLQFMHAPDVPALQAQLTQLLERLHQRADAGRAVQRLGRKFASGLEPSDEGQLKQIDGLESVSLSSVLEKRPGLFCISFQQRNMAVLQIPGSQLSFPLDLREALAFIARDHRAFRLDELPGDWTRESRLLFARKLVTAGVLRVKEFEEHGESMKLETFRSRTFAGSTGD